MMYAMGRSTGAQELQAENAEYIGNDKSIIGVLVTVLAGE
jgi:hypothetical protein